MDSGELQPRRAGANGAEEEAGDRGPGGGAAADERDRDAVEAVASAEDARVLVLGAEDQERAGDAGERARERHRFADAAVRGNAARVRGLRAGAGRAPFESAARAGEEEPDGGGDGEREREAGVRSAGE